MDSNQAVTYGCTSKLTQLHKQAYRYRRCKTLRADTRISCDTVTALDSREGRCQQPRVYLLRWLRNVSLM